MPEDAQKYVRNISSNQYDNERERNVTCKKSKKVMKDQKTLKTVEGKKNDITK
jgi:hypothetical protein